MIEDVVIVDAVLHAFNHRLDNFQDAEMGRKYAEFMYRSMHVDNSPRDEQQYLAAPERWIGKVSGETLAYAAFAESPTDFGAYHILPLYHFYKDGGSPQDIGLEAAKVAPNRMWFFGAVPFGDLSRACDEIDRQIEEVGIVGIKLYPAGMVDGRLRPFNIDDPEHGLPIVEHAVKRGITNVALHKSYPMGPVVPMQTYNVRDIEAAAMSFPDVQFEVVHGGWMFLEDTNLLAQFFPNVWINWENIPTLLHHAPRKFAHILGSMLRSELEDRILWATGTCAMHARPQVERFWDFEMPEDLMAGYGYPEITREIKAKIFGQNYARLHGLDLDTELDKVKDDTFSVLRRDGLLEPWSHAPVLDPEA